MPSMQWSRTYVISEEAHGLHKLVGRYFVVRVKVEPVHERLGLLELFLRGIGWCVCMRPDRRQAPQLASCSSHVPHSPQKRPGGA